MWYFSVVLRESAAVLVRVGVSLTAALKRGVRVPMTPRNELSLPAAQRTLFHLIGPAEWD